MSGKGKSLHGAEGRKERGMDGCRGRANCGIHSLPSLAGGFKLRERPTDENATNGHCDKEINETKD